MGEATEMTIKSFLLKMAAQDNRGTKAPYYYVINSEEEYQADARNCDETKIYYDGEDYDSREALEESIRECADDHTEEELAKLLSTADYEATEYGVSKRWVQHQMFLTEEDAKNHLASNKHHYSNNAHTYVGHAWRAPELTKFITALFKHFEVDSGKQYL